MTVYVVQQPQRWNHEKQAMESAFDVVEAEEFGDLVYLLSPMAKPFNVEDSILGQIKEGLARFCDEDYLLLIGNPVLIGITCTVAAGQNNGSVRLLQWSGKNKKYIPITVKNLLTSMPNNVE